MERNEISAASRGIFCTLWSSHVCLLSYQGVDMSINAPSWAIKLKDERRRRSKCCKSWFGSGPVPFSYVCCTAMLQTILDLCILARTKRDPAVRPVPMIMEMAANNCNPENLASFWLFNIAPCIGSPVRQLLIVSWVAIWPAGWGLTKL